MKTSWKTIAVIAVPMGVLAWYWLYSNPYLVVNAGNGGVYKINRRTGESSLLHGRTEIPIAPEMAGDNRAHERQHRKQELVESLSADLDSYEQLYEELVTDHGSEDAALAAISTWVEASIEWEDALKAWHSALGPKPGPLPTLGREKNDWSKLLAD